jgi:hypothetical protein
MQSSGASSKNGQNFRALLLKYLEFQQNLFLKSPTQTHVQPAEVIDALKINESEMQLLGQLLSLAHLGGSENPTSNWGVTAMTEADGFEKKTTSILISIKLRSDTTIQKSLSLMSNAIFVIQPYLSCHKLNEHYLLAGKIIQLWHL